MENQEYYITLNLPDNYNNFDDYIDESREPIYKSIVELFKGFLEQKNTTLILHVDSVVGGVKWDTNFNFTIKENHILSQDILPYFEGNEDFETCVEIKELCKKLNGDELSPFN